MRIFSWDGILGHQFGLTKDSSLLLYAIHTTFAYWWILEKTIFFSGFKNTYPVLKNPRNMKTRVYSWIALLTNGKLRVEGTRVYAQKTRLNMLFKNSISVLHVPVTLICSLTARLSPPSGVSSTRKGRPPPSTHTTIRRLKEQLRADRLRRA